jgi:hypothetical protein
MMLKKIVLLSVLLVAVIGFINAESLAESLESLSGSAGKAYVNPMVTAFGSDMNSGWFHKVPTDSTFSWDLEFGVVSMGTMFTSKDENFNVEGNFSFTRDQAVEMAAQFEGDLHYDALVEQIIRQTFVVNIYGPTVTGPAYDENTGENSVMVEFPSQDVTFTDGGVEYTRTIDTYQKALGVGGLLTDLPLLPLAAPQLSIGTVYGTQFSFRILPQVELTPEIGKLKYIGYGIQHNPAVWLPVEIPVSVALSFFTQNLEIGDIAEASTSTVGLNFSRTFGAKLLSVTPYAGAAWEASKMKFHYDYPIEFEEGGVVVESLPINFEVDGKNNSRITAGLSFRIGLINLNADYSFAQYPSASAGVMLNFSW